MGRFRRIAGLTLLGTGAALVTGSVRNRLRAIDVVAPELKHPILFVPLPFGNRPMLRVMRALPTPASPVEPGVTVREEHLPARGEHPGVRAFVYRPDVPATTTPAATLAAAKDAIPATAEDATRGTTTAALLWIHGGGFVIGSPVTYHQLCSRIAAELGITVVSVDYRLAPEDPFPAGLEDCYTALAWLHAQSGGLGVDPARIAIGGDSAGGGLAACLAQLAHDRGELPVAFQLLVYPMLDDRTVLRTDHAGTGTFVWTPSNNRFGWTSYLGHPPSPGPERPYAAAARREDLAGLPPAWIGVGAIDLFHAEDVDYAQRLRDAGVDCELLVVPGMYHGADGFLDGRAPSMTAFRAAGIHALRRALT